MCGCALAQAAAVEDPGCRTETLVLRPGEVQIRLRDAFVLPGTDSLWTRQGRLLRGRDYAFDHTRGEIHLLTARAAGETLWVRSCRLLAPPPLERVHLRYRPPSPATADSAAPVPLAAAARPATGRDPGVANSGATLALNGNKSVAVEFGSNQDATLRQSLDLSLSGQLAQGLELTGVLSDRSVPLSAQGSTQDLQSLDKVLLELRAQDGSAALGDVPLAYRQGEFGRIERRLQGAQAEWRFGGLRVTGAAASAQGEYQRLQFSGVEGLQGPYALTDRAGNQGITVVAGSEQVTLDGARLTRGESADYFIDYERARLTFSNRRPITAASRITVEYQYAVTNYRRNLSAAGLAWQGQGGSAWAQLVREGDDRGRPLDRVLSADDRLSLALAGDSVAIGPGVSPGPGDYDTVRVSAGFLVYAWAGPDSGVFRIAFARVGVGRGEYAESTIVAGRTAYRYVGAGLGAFRVGTTLPSPQTLQMLTAGGRWAFAGLTLDAEGATSNDDRNTFSSLDDGSDRGFAGRLALAGSRALPGRGGQLFASVSHRQVDANFRSFTPLEAAFAEEDWGLPAGTDLDHARRGEATAGWRPGRGGEAGELSLGLVRLVTADGFAGWKRGGAWAGRGRLPTRAEWWRSDGASPADPSGDGGRDRWLGEVRWPLAWVQPRVRVEQDERRLAADSATTGTRFREWTAELASGPRLPWRASLGGATRAEQSLSPAGAFVAQQDVQSVRGALESPPGGMLGAVLSAERRDVRPRAGTLRTRSDLASLRLRADDRDRGLAASTSLEVTSEGVNPQVRQLEFVGSGRGGYDALGNYVGTGDYDLVLVISPTLERLARAAGSARLAWTFGESESWHGSRAEFVSETDARRRGALRGSEVFLSPGAALADPSYARASVTQRFESDLAPGSRLASIRLRVERNVVADRSYENFSQGTDQRTGELRWRVRPSPPWSVESQVQFQWQRATQAIDAGARYARTLVQRGGQLLAVWQPGAGLRTAAALEATWSRPAGADADTRTFRIGPDLGVSIGRGGRAELSVRRAFVSGPAALSLLPSADPAGAARWDATARLDWRVRESTTLSLASALRERPDQKTVSTARAELRAFF